MDGLLNINKPAGMTSHDVVSKLRRLLNEKKVGHTGTLDPDATGVLPLCLGKATKIIQFLKDDEKGYEGTITLGVETDSLDASGEVVGISDSSNIKLDDVQEVLSRFVGEIDQIPPMVSAVKVNGKRLYSIARQGKTINRAARRIHIYDLELLDFRRETGRWVEPPRPFTSIDFRVRCSRGTYVRVLAADVGGALGCGAHLSRLVRTKSGFFELKDSIRLEDIQADPQIALQSMRSIDDVLSFIPSIIITDVARSLFLNGVPVDGAGIASFEKELRIDDLVRVHDEAGELLGIAKSVGNFSPEASLDPRTLICKVARMLK